MLSSKTVVEEGGQGFLASKVAIAWTPAGHQSAGGRWCVIAFIKEHYLSLIMLRLCSGDSGRLAGLGIDPSGQYRLSHSVLGAEKNLSYGCKLYLET